ncbi:vitamin K epoxide reductase family protein [Amycolatopsis tucumanensis]|uniref:Vitamin K epoxide reductase family protein n=1 Tax=Amycolatopsis tucumanensis TaxID=401106 RepID=A0ABP7JW96_9PSEU|nr:vitamin K epoxide reductase family protein [Amycolatopsis tucumanensis]MCF6427648.1 vitamin K epoxide reductase family protein [Amycolatopsis tucumanensis]
MTTATTEPTGRRSAFTTRLLPWLLTVAGLVGLAASVTLTIEKIASLRDPDYVPSCSIDPVLSCGSIMRAAQAEVFGFPNPLLGIAGFAVVVTTGVVLLARASLPQWYWLGLQAGTTLGVVFVHWLIYQSLYEIGALCPYCMVVWAVTIPIFWYTTVHNLGQRHLRAPRAAVNMLAAYHGLIITAWYLIIGIAVLAAFWDYWITLV